MAIVYDFKNIKKACNDISTDILGGDKVIVFEPEVEFDEPCTKPPTPRFPPANNGAVPAPPKAGITKKFGYCEACRSRLVNKPGYGWYCADCDAFVEV